MTQIRVRIPDDANTEFVAAAEAMGVTLGGFLTLAARDWLQRNPKWLEASKPKPPTDTKPKGRPKKNPYEESVRLGGLHLLSPEEQRRNQMLMQQQFRPQWAQKLHKHLTTVGEKGWEETAQHFIDLMGVKLPEGAWEEWCTERDLDPDDPDLHDTERGRMVNLLVWRDKVYEPWREEQGL